MLSGLAASSARRPPNPTAAPSAPPTSASSDALGQELPEQPPSAGAERRADRELPLPRLGAREDQIRQIGAGDEQHEADRSLQHPQRGADAADHVGLHRLHLQPMRCRSGWACGACRLPLSAPLRDHRVEIGLRLRERHAVLQSADQIQEVAAARRFGNVFRIDRQRQEDLDALVVDVVAGRHDADDARRHAVDLNDATEDALVAAEVALPRPARDDRRRLRRRAARSASLNSRPRSGGTPSTGSSSGVTIAELTRRGRSGVPRFTEPSR